MKTEPMNEASGEFEEEVVDDAEVEVEEADDAGDEEEEEESDSETSLEQLLSRRKASEDDDEEESILDLSPEERIESLTVRAVPKQANEFICSNCRLVKNQSQLADAKRGLCRDCV